MNRLEGVAPPLILTKTRLIDEGRAEQQEWQPVSYLARGPAHLESFDGLLSTWGGHDAFLNAGDRLKARLSAQRARRRGGCQGTNRCCGEIARPLILWSNQVSILIVLKVFEVWTNSGREEETGREVETNKKVEETRERRNKTRNGKNKHKTEEWGLSREDRKKTKGRGDQCKTTLYWAKTNTQHYRQIRRAAVSSLALF